MGVPVCTIDATGIHAPAFADVLNYLKEAYWGVYGSDVYLENDSQDGQFLGIVAAAIHDVNSQLVAAYNAFSPATAQGTGLSTVVKINGIARKVPTFSNADLVVIGQAGTIIRNGAARDTNGVRWVLPATVTIPASGTITVTATCSVLGAIRAQANMITQIARPTLGWQSVTNPAAATPGAPVEDDAQLRQRQAVSTMIPSQTVLDGILGAIAAIPGVSRYRAYENDTNGADANGMPGHSLGIVVDGGDDTAIANAIAAKKSPGTSTVGTTAVTVTDAYGIPHTIRFYRPTQVAITWKVTVKNLGTGGFTTDTATAIQQSISDWTNALGIGNSLLLSRAYMAANLWGGGASSSFEILSISMARGGGSPLPADIPIAFTEAPACDPSYVIITPVT